MQNNNPGLIQINDKLLQAFQQYHHNLPEYVKEKCFKTNSNLANSLNCMQKKLEKIISVYLKQIKEGDEKINLYKDLISNESAETRHFEKVYGDKIKKDHRTIKELNTQKRKDNMAIQSFVTKIVEIGKLLEIENIDSYSENLYNEVMLRLNRLIDLVKMMDRLAKSIQKAYKEASETLGSIEEYKLKDNENIHPEDITTLNTMLDEINNYIVDLRAINETNKQNYKTDVRSIRTQFENSLSVKEQEITNLRDRLQSIDETNTDISSDRDKQFQDILSQKEQNIDYLKEQLNLTQKKLIDNNNAFDEIKKDYDENQIKSKQMDELYQNLKRQHDEQLQSFANKEREYISQIEILRNRQNTDNVDEESTIRNSEDALASNRLYMENLEKLQNTNNDLQRESIKIQKELQLIVAENENLKLSEAKLKKKYEDATKNLKLQKENLNNKSARMKTEMQNIISENKNLKLSETELKKKYEDLEKNQNTIAEALAVSQSEEKSLKEKYNILMGRFNLKKLQPSVGQYTHCQTELKKQIESNKKLTKRLTESLVLLRKHELSGSQNQIKKLKKKLLILYNIIIKNVEDLELLKRAKKIYDSERLFMESTDFLARSLELQPPLIVATSTDTELLANPIDDDTNYNTVGGGGGRDDLVLPTLTDTLADINEVESQTIVLQQPTIDQTLNEVEAQADMSQEVTSDRSRINETGSETIISQQPMLSSSTTNQTETEAAVLSILPYDDDDDDSNLTDFYEQFEVGAQEVVRRIFSKDNNNDGVGDDNDNTTMIETDQVSSKISKSQDSEKIEPIIIRIRKDKLGSSHEIKTTIAPESGKIIAKKTKDKISKTVSSHSKQRKESRKQRPYPKSKEFISTDDSEEVESQTKVSVEKKQTNITVPHQNVQKNITTTSLKKQEKTSVTKPSVQKQQTSKTNTSDATSSRKKKSESESSKVRQSQVITSKTSAPPKIQKKPTNTDSSSAATSRPSSKQTGSIPKTTSATAAAAATNTTTATNTSVSSSKENVDRNPRKRKFNTAEEDVQISLNRKRPPKSRKMDDEFAKEQRRKFATLERGSSDGEEEIPILISSIPSEVDSAIGEDTNTSDISSRQILEKAQTII